MSQGFNSTMLSVTGKTIKDAGVLGSYSKAIYAGRAILAARESGDDPVEAVVNSSGGYKIFEGSVGGYTNERKGSFVYGNVWIEGSGDYEGKTFRLWYKNENQISWIDEKPYVTCPDPFTVLDKNTALGLSNFRTDWWTPGREVAVTAMKAFPFWRTEKGLKIYNPKHFGFDIPYTPIEEVIG